MSCVLVYTCHSDRKVSASPIYRIRNRDENAALPGVLASVLAKMNASPHDDVKEIDSNRPYIVLDQNTWTWARIKWRSELRLSRHRLPTASSLILLQDLGFGKDGRVWKACSASGFCCVVKFSHRIDKAVILQSPLDRLEIEMGYYKQTDEDARIIYLDGNPALQLLYFSPLDLTVRENAQMAKAALRDVIVKHRLVPTDRQRQHLMFSPTRKVVVVIDRADWRPLAADESPEAELEQHLLALELDDLALSSPSLLATSVVHPS